MHRALGTDVNFMTSRLTKNVRQKLFSYFNSTCAKSTKIAYMHTRRKMDYKIKYPGTVTTGQPFDL